MLSFNLSYIISSSKKFDSSICTLVRICRLLDEQIETAVQHMERQLVDGHSLLSRSNAFVRFALDHLVELADRESSESDATARKVVDSLRSMAPERRRALLERFAAEQLLAQEARAFYAEATNLSPFANDYLLPAHIRRYFWHHETRRPELLLTISKALRLVCIHIPLPFWKQIQYTTILYDSV